MNPKLDISRMLDKVKLPNTFLTLGFIIIVISIILKYEIGIKLGLLTLIFGAIFRVLNIIGGVIKKPRKARLTWKIFFMLIGKLLLWLVFIALYAYLVNKVIIFF